MTIIGESGMVAAARMVRADGGGAWRDGHFNFHLHVRPLLGLLKLLLLQGCAPPPHHLVVPDTASRSS